MPPSSAHRYAQTTCHKHIIYQLFVRYFGNKNPSPTYQGTLAQNGCGKFNDITTKALNELVKLGVTHIWYTGILEHATMSDFTAQGISLDNPQVVKGIAGSPYAIKDYYDVAPDLAENVANRMQEFTQLLTRTHQEGLKVIIDFVPNHLARTYHSDNLPKYATEFGVNDNQEVFFSSQNDFYYMPHQPLVLPTSQLAAANFQHPLKNQPFNEFPAKATGNNIFNPNPSANDWFETIKLNYGIDYAEHASKHFVPKPPLWIKMRDILIFWAKKGVDGFRCDMVELVPVEFWSWVIADLKKKFPHLLFIGEAYDNTQYNRFLHNGKFDYLYDKVDFYDGIKRLIRDDDAANVADITQALQCGGNGFSAQMLRFLENHDEVRIASEAFAHNPWYALPGMVLAATLSTGPVMIYNGQEVGERAEGAQGFSGNDGRSTIFDYWNIPSLQKWMNKGAFDGGQLTNEEQILRTFYSKLLNVCKKTPAITQGSFYELLTANQYSAGFNGKTYAFLRYKQQSRVLILANFNRTNIDLKLYFPADMIEKLALKSSVIFTDLLTEITFTTAHIAHGLTINMPATGAAILAF